MQKLMAILLALFGAGCTPNEEASPSSSTPDQVQAVQRDCLRIVKSEIGNILDQQSPIFQRSLDSCNKKAGHYNNEYVTCIQQSPYSNALECAYKVRGIDRSERDPSLKDMKVGEYGAYSSSISEILPALYKDADPKRSIDKITLESYLGRRDNFREIARLPRIEDSHVPVDVTHSSFEQGDMKYWVVRQTYQELQLAKIMRETQHGAESVLCAQYGSIDKKLMLSDGLCAGLLRKHFKVISPGA